MRKEKSVTIEIEETIYKELEAAAREQGSKLEDEVVEAIRADLERRRGYSNDPFFQIGKGGKSGLRDLAKAHDKYLYGRKEGE
ncbi:MAG: hypothetical protein DDT31_01894 [Syntrophomonadaceae bacterium]|nr:hypothetical protein [Bacillota bacterium]